MRVWVYANPNLEQTTTDGRCTETQVTSRPGTFGPKVWSATSKCAQKTAKEAVGHRTIKLQAARWMRDIYDIPPDEVEYVDDIVRNARKKPEIPVQPATSCVEQLRIPTVKAPRRKLQCQKKAGGDPWH